MNNKLLFSVLIFLFSFQIYSQTFTPGETYFGENEYIEFKAGNIPIIISAPHGGGLEPLDIPDRDCTGCVYVRDSRTQELIRQLSDAIFVEFGCYPYIIINRLHRRKLDANRDIGDAADGDPMAEQAWGEFHDFIQTAKDYITQKFGKGIYLDLHGHGHDIQRLELGYRISKTKLQMTNSELDGFVNDASIRNLENDNLNNLPLSQLIRGENSFGEFFQSESFPAVPSQTDPFPIGSEPYFSGGYNTERHGSKLGGVIDGIQVECNWDNVRDTESNREVFATATTQVLKKYFEKHYFGIDFLNQECGLVSNYNIVEKNDLLSFQISPNPVKDQLALSWKIPIPFSFSISIFNKLGQVYYHNNVRELDLDFINISHLPNGLYFIKLENENFVSLKKFIKLDF